MKDESLNLNPEKYKRIFAGLNVIAILHDARGNIVEVNDRTIEYFDHPVLEFSSLNIADLISESERPQFMKFVQNTVYAGSASQEFIIIKNSSSAMTAKISSSLIDSYGEKVIVSIIEEVAEIKEIERELREKNNFIDSILENIPNMIFVKDAQELRFVMFNKAGEDLIGYRRDEMLGKNDYDLFPKKEADFFTYKDRGALKSGELSDISEEQIHTKYNGVRTLHTKKITINDDSGNPKYLLGISEDITERKSAEDMLKKNEEYFRSVVENANDLIVETDYSGKFLYVSPNYKRILGYDPKELMGTSIFENIHPDDKAGIIAEFSRAVITQSSGRATFRYRDKNGEWRWFETNGNPIQTSSGPVRIMLHSREITERIKAREELTRSIGEKESLLREIHHRVKNNLQVISSLLSLQSDYARDRDPHSLFQESQNRIYSIALVHEKLYQSKDLGHIDIYNYINDLAENLKSVYLECSKEIEVSIVSEHLSIDIDRAIPCGLILNELLSNSFKHAFTSMGCSEHNGDIPKLISVGFKNGRNGNYVLSVKDNGVGLPGDLNYKNTETLGLQLVCTLTDQLCGNVEIEGDSGCGVEIEFPAIQAKQ